MILEGCGVILNDQEAMRNDESRKGEVVEKEKMQLKTAELVIVVGVVCS